MMKTGCSVPRVQCMHFPFLFPTFGLGLFVTLFRFGVLSVHMVTSAIILSLLSPASARLVRGDDGERGERRRNRVARLR
jgi:hypothetical protein